MHLLAPVMGYGRTLLHRGFVRLHTQISSHTHTHKHPLPCTFWHPLWENFAAQGVRTAAHTHTHTHTNANIPCHAPSGTRYGRTLLHRGFIRLHTRISSHTQMQAPLVTHLLTPIMGASCCTGGSYGCMPPMRENSSRYV